MTQLTSTTIETIRDALSYERRERQVQFIDSSDPYYTEKIAEIDAALTELDPFAPLSTGVWEPIDFVQLAHGLEMHSDEIALTIGSGKTALATYIWPDDAQYAVCKRTAMPVPNWDEAPAWSNWWTVYPSGEAWWWTHEPIVNGDDWTPCAVDHETDADAWDSAPRVNIPMGIDWRLLKQQRQ